MIEISANDRRAAAIRRHRASPLLVSQLKQRIRKLVMEDLSAKAIGVEVNLSAGKVCRRIHALGFRRMYVNAEERRVILKMRAERAAQSGDNQAAA